MNNKLLVALSLIAGQAMAMELPIDNEQATPTDTTEQKVAIPIQDKKREIPARFIPLIGALAGFYVAGTPLHMSPITLVSLDTWQLIEDQLERVYAMNQGNQQVRDEIIADYSQLDTTRFIDLIYAVDFLTIPLLKEITLEIAQNRLTFHEMLELPKMVRNEVIKRKALKIAGPAPGKEQAVCRGHEGGVTSVCVTTDDKIVSGSYDNTVRIWSMDGKQLAVCRGHEDVVLSACVTADGKIVSGSKDKTVRVWDMNGQQLAVCRGHEKMVNSVCITQDNKIVSGSKDKTVRIWDMNGKELAVCRGHENEIESVCVTADGKIVSGSKDKTVRVWSMDGQELVVCWHGGWITSVCVTPDGNIVAGSCNTTVRVWSMDGQELLAVCEGHEEVDLSVCVTPDNKIVSGSRDKTVRIWDMNGKELAVCRGHEGGVGVNAVRITPDGKIVSGSDDKTVRGWDMNGEELAVCRGHESAVWSVCVTPDGKIVSGSFDNTVRIWDLMSLLDRLSVMSKEQAKSLKRLEWTEGLLDDLGVVVERKIHKIVEVFEYTEEVPDEIFYEVDKHTSGLKSKACKVISKYFWKEIEKILEEEELDSETKKRKELENSDNNPAKKVRLLGEEELVTENNLGRNHA